MSNNNSNNNSEHTEKTFNVAGPVNDGTIVASFEADKILYLSYQIIAVLSGAPDVTFTLIKKNDKNAPWFDTGESVSMNISGVQQAFLELDLAKSEHYAIRVNSVAGGSVDSLKIYLEGK